MKTTIKYKIDGGDEQKYICISPFSPGEVVYLLTTKRKHRGHKIEILDITVEKA
jgi:hypothetical protein